MLTKIFDRFYQADNSLTRNYEGTGIGLSIVKEYVEMHNGIIDVRSTPGTETVFEVTFPVRNIDSNNIQYDFFNYPAESDNASLYISDFSLEGFEDDIFSRNAITEGRDLILVVDDNSDIRRYIKDILSDKYAVIEAQNGAAGLEKVRLCKPDLVISDIMMPEMDGYQLLKEIKDNPAFAQIPVVLLTAKADESGKADGLDAGADDYLSKPFSSKELSARVKSLLKLYRFQKLIIERNKEIEADLDIAKIIQSKLMLEGYNAENNENFSVQFYPLDKVAGDFYNYIEDEETVKIFIADVSGHGLASAFLALITKNELDNQITRTSDTQSVLDHLNLSVSRYSVRCNFVTAFFCIYNRKTGMLKYSKAGHNPPILCRKSDNSITELSTYGRALGFFPDIKFEEKEIHLEKSDRIIFYTDGLIEISDKSGEMFGLERLISFIIENRDFIPAEFSDKLMRNIEIFAMGEAFEDDVTLLVYDIP
jgi:serine phosphatase RsbU (regulator of sigma subunit)